MNEDGHGEDRLHLGWNQDGKVCLGAGPVRLRYTRQEAEELRDALGALLYGTAATRHCGCAPEAAAGPSRRVPDKFGFYREASYPSGGRGLVWE